MRKTRPRKTNGSHTASKKKKGSYFQSGYAYLACEIGPTRFEDECVVYIDRLDGGRSVALASPKEVKVSGTLDQIAKGEALVRVVRRIEGGFVIDPPGESLNSAGRIPVPQNRVRFP